MKISDILRNFLETRTDSPVTVRILVAAFGRTSLAFLILIFALLCALPIPIPGIHMFLSLPLFCLTAQQALGRRTVWFPRQILDRPIPREAFDKLSSRALPAIEKIEKFSKPRLVFITEGVSYRFFGVVAFLLTAVMGLPLWMTNTVPSIAIAFMALGLLTRDGLAILFGTVMGIAWSCFLFFVYIGMVIVLFEQAMTFWSHSPILNP